MSAVQPDFEVTLRTKLREEHARSIALQLRLNAIDCAQLRGELLKLGPQFDALGERCMQWGQAMAKGERAINELLSTQQEGGQ